MMIKTPLKAGLCIALLLGSVQVYAQNYINHIISLDNYRIPMNQKGVRIGKVMHTSGQTDGVFKLKQDTAKLFTIAKDGTISLRKGKQVVSSSEQHSYGITITRGTKAYDLELVKNEFLKNKVIAHRGAWLETGVMQNSIRSFQHAVDMGCEGSEFDVWMSKDGKVVLSHDPHIGGLAVEQSTAAQLYQSTLAKGDPVPSLEQFVEVAKKQNKTRMVLEIKYSSTGRTIELTDSVVSVIHKMKAQGYVEYISFTYNAMKRILELDPTAKVSYLTGDVELEKLKADKFDGIDFQFTKFEQDPTLLERAKRLKLNTNIWTVNDPEMLKKYLLSDVDMITTDKPKLLLELIQKEKSKL